MSCFNNHCIHHVLAWPNCIGWHELAVQSRQQRRYNSCLHDAGTVASMGIHPAINLLDTNINTKFNTNMTITDNVLTLRQIMGHGSCTIIVAHSNIHTYLDIIICCNITLQDTQEYRRKRDYILVYILRRIC